MTWALGYCHPGTVPAAFHESVVLTLRGPDPPAHVISVGGGPRIHALRNDLVRRFLDTDADTLVMVDTDMVFSPADVSRLLERSGQLGPMAVVGGLCFASAHGVDHSRAYPTLYAIEPGGVRIIRDYPRDALVEVDATGAAFLALPRKLLEAVRERFGRVPDSTLTSDVEWFAETVMHGHSFGEDWTFCLRAKSVGGRVLVDTSIRVGHLRTFVLTEDTAGRWEV